MGEDQQHVQLNGNAALFEEEVCRIYNPAGTASMTCCSTVNVCCAEFGVSTQECVLLKQLLQLDQGHLFASWPPPGTAMQRLAYCSNFLVVDVRITYPAQVKLIIRSGSLCSSLRI